MNPVNDRYRINSEITLHEMIKVLWKGKILIIIITFLFIVASIIYALLTKEIFTTNTVFITKTGNSNLSSLASLAGISLGGNSNNVDPSDYLDKVIMDKDFLADILIRKWEFNGDSLFLDQIWQIEKDTSFPDCEYRFEKAKLDYIRNNGVISISKDKKNAILTLTVNMPSAKLSYDLNRFVITKLSNYIRNSIQSQAKEKRMFIEERISEVTTVLQKSENSLAFFKERNIMSSSPKVLLEEMRLQRAVTLNQEIYIQFQKQYELARIEELNDQTLIQVLRSPEIPVIRTKPKRTKIVITGTIFGFLVGTLIVFLISGLKNPVVKEDLISR